ncbi:hypothetical protein [Microbispora bryophytorum]
MFSWPGGGEPPPERAEAFAARLARRQREPARAGAVGMGGGARGENQ